MHHLLAGTTSPSPTNPKAFLILILILETGMNGTFVAQDLILFFVFFEVVLLPMYFMIGVWGGEQRQYASIKFFLFTLFGSALMIVSFLALYFLPRSRRRATSTPSTCSCCPASAAHRCHHRRAADLRRHVHGLRHQGADVPVPHLAARRPHPGARRVGSVILAAVLLKLGTYGFIRIAIPILPDAAQTWAPWIGGLAVIGIIYGALCCLAQTDMKRLIAFSSVAHMGFVMLGIATLTTFGINAAIFGMVAHGLITGMLFFIAGSVKERYHTLEIKRLGGMLVSGAPPGLDPRLLRHGLARACPAWPASGASSRPSSRRTARRRPERRPVPGLHGRRRHRHRAGRRLPALAVPAHRLRRAAEPSSPTTPTSTTSTVARVDGVGADAGAASSSSASSRTSSSRSPTRAVIAARDRRTWPGGEADPAMLAAAGPSTWQAPHVDYHALAPEIVLAGVIVVVLLVDLFVRRGQGRARRRSPASACWRALIPVVTLAVDGDAPGSMFGGAYVVDKFTLVLKALFLLSGYVVVLLSTNYIDEGDYWEGEYYFLVLSSVLGMMVMASARDLISIFIALELLSIPAYMLAAWRKRDLRSNEAGMKYYLMGVFASAVMLYGMSLIYGVTGTTLLAEIGAKLGGDLADAKPIVTLAIVFVLVGFAFKVSAVPFHTWAPDTYEGAPTPVTAFLAVASKAAGFVALLELVFVGFFGRHDVWQPLMWVLAAAHHDRRQPHRPAPDQHRAHAGLLGIAQAGYILAPFAVAGPAPSVERRRPHGHRHLPHDLRGMNLGAFAVVIAVARKTRSAEIDSASAACSVRARAGRVHDASSCSRWPASRPSAAGSPSS